MISAQKQKTRSCLVKIQKSILPILKKNNVLKAGIFGSFARGEEKKTSDIDILVQLKKGKSMFDLVKLEEELTIKTKRKVQAITYNSLHPLLKEKILSEEVRIYGKRS